MVKIAIIHFVNYPSGQSRSCMASVMKYASQKDKTTWEGRQLVSGFNCRPESAYDDFLRTKLLYHKDGGTMFFHLVQSFPAGEDVPPDAAHAAALKLAEFFQGREVLVCTHTDRDHIHSHLIVNSVGLEDGKKLHIGAPELEALRQRNDQVCTQFGLPVFQPEPERKARPMSDAEYRSAAKGESWKFQTMNAIDRCMRRAATREDFIREMERLGYQVRWETGRKNITYTYPNGKKVRDRKLHEEKYWKEKMEREFELRQQAVAGGIEAAQSAARGAGHGGAGADGTGTRAGASPHGGGVAGAVRYPVDHGRGAGGADCAPGGAVPASAVTLLHLAGGGHDQGSGGDPLAAGKGALAAGTGWEEERMEFLLSQLPSAAPVSGLAPSAAGLGRAVGAVVQLGHTLEDDQSPVHVTRPYSDSKTLRREREKKIAAGHKPDDRAEYTMEQTM